MAERRPKAGSIVHVEFHSRDPAKTRRFYGEVFGWKFKDVPEMDYTLFEAPSPPHGGLMTPMEGMPPGVLNYILSDSIDDTLERIEEAGGTVLSPKTEIPNMGWSAVFRDPEGTVQALFENKPQPRGGATSRRRSTRRGGTKKQGARRSGRRR